MSQETDKTTKVSDIFGGVVAARELNPTLRTQASSHTYESGGVSDDGEVVGSAAARLEPKRTYAKDNGGIAPQCLGNVNDLDWRVERAVLPKRSLLRRAWEWIKR